MIPLAVKNLRFSYPKTNGGTPSVPFGIEDISFSLAGGELLGVLGPNGSGKSTLLRLLCGILRPDSGSVSLIGRSLETFSQKAVAQQVAMVPQEISTVFAITVEQMVSLGRFPHQRWLGWPNARDKEVVEESLRRTDLWDIRHRLTSHLSGGERRRVLLARALAQEAKILLLDEPTAHLDPRHQMEFVWIVEELRRTKGLTVIAVLHDVNLALQWCPRLLLMKRGHAAAHGPTSAVFSPELFQEVYGLPAEMVKAVNGLPQVNFFHSIEKQEEKR